MAVLANRIVTRHHGPELLGSSFHLSSTSRFWSSVRQCGSLHVSRCKQTVYFYGRFFKNCSGSIRRVRSRSPHTSRASKSDDSAGRSKDRKAVGDFNNDAGADSETDEIEDVVDEVERDIIAEEAPQQQVSKGNSGFWGKLCGKVRQEIDEVNEAEAHDEANDEDSDSEQEEEQNVEVKQEEVRNPTEEDVPKSQTSETGFWRRWWREEAETPDVDPGTKEEDELLLRDLENLQFRWKELLEPTPENLLALALTTLLGLAGLQIVWQMVVVATAITFSALKYTVLAAIIVGLLIFVL